MNYTFNINDAPAANCFVINSDFYQLNADRKLQNSKTPCTKTQAHIYNGTIKKNNENHNKLIAKMQYMYGQINTNP